MSVAKKVKALIDLKGVKVSELAKYFKIQDKAMYNKLNRDNLTVEDLIKITDCLGCELSITIDNNHKIILDKEDIYKIFSMSNDTPEAEFKMPNKLTKPVRRI